MLERFEFSFDKGRIRGVIHGRSTYGVDTHVLQDTTPFLCPGKLDEQCSARPVHHRYGEGRDGVEVFHVRHAHRVSNLRHHLTFLGENDEVVAELEHGAVTPSAQRRGP